MSLCSAFRGRWILFSGSAIVHLFFALVALATCGGAQARDLTVSVARRDLRPLGSVAVTLTGGVNLDGATDESGRVVFLALPAAGAITITPSRSGFRFEPTQLTIPASANDATAVFTAYPTETDLGLSIEIDNANPFVGGVVNGVITLRNFGAAAATDVGVAIGSLPGLILEDADATQGALKSRTYDTIWMLPQLDAGASAKVNYRARAILAEANVLAVALVEEMDQRDVDPSDNSTYLIVPTRAARAKLSLTLAIDPAPVKIGETAPVRLTVRNEGPQDATQIGIRSYLPPGASFLTSNDPSPLYSNVAIARLVPGAEKEFNGVMKVRFDGTYTLIANVTGFEEELPVGAAWPEARGTFTVEPAYSRVTLLGFTDPPNPRVGDDVTVMYVVKNNGPDAVTGLQLFTRADYRLDLSRFTDVNPPVPPVEGPFVFGDVLPANAYTYIRSRYSVKAAGDLTNYFTVTYQDQYIANAEDHPELAIPLKTLPADVGLSLDANPRDVKLTLGEAVTIDFKVHNDGPQAARAISVDYSPRGLETSENDEVIHADRTLRPGGSGFIDVVEAGETVLLRKHFVAARAGVYTNAAEIPLAAERPDLLMPIVARGMRLEVTAEPYPTELGISVAVDKAQVNVGEYAIFVVTVTNKAAQAAFNVKVRETDSFDVDAAFETVRSYGPNGDDRVSTAYRRTIPRIEAHGSYAMSRTMRVRKPVTIQYLAKIEEVNGLIETEIPAWNATTQVTGAQVTSDIAPFVLADRTNVVNGDLVNFAVIALNPSTRLASHPVFDGAQSAGFQLLNPSLTDYGYFWDNARPRDLQSSRQALWEWYEIRPREELVSWISTYVVGAGELTASAQLSKLDQLDADPSNDLALATIHAAPASASVSVRQAINPQNPRVGNLVMFTTEIRNEGTNRVTGLVLTEASSGNLELNSGSAVNGVSGDLKTSIWDSLVRLPALEPGQNFVWQRTYAARRAGNAWRRVRVERVDQTAAALPESNAEFTVQAAQADLELQLLEAPAVGQNGIPTVAGVRVRNLGPDTASGVKVAINVPADALYLGTLTYGPRANYVFLESNAFQTALLPGQSATVSFYVTPRRGGVATSSVQVVTSDQSDPNLANNSLSWTLDVGAEPAIPPILSVRKVRTDFFDQTPIAEIQIDQAALNRLAPYSTFYLDRSTNLRDWEYLRLVGFIPLAPVTYTDQADPGVTTRAYRLRSF